MPGRFNDEYWMERALKYAVEKATDPSTQNGAVIITADHMGTAWGANHFPRNVRESSERWERPLKYSYVEHAERNAIYQAARNGVCLAGAKMYCPWFACADCARAIIQAGVEEVIGLDNERLGGIDGFPNNDVAKRWDDTCRIGLEMLKEAGVYTRWITGDFGVRILRGGEVFTV